jgi:hypothetical protein
VALSNAARFIQSYDFFRKFALALAVLVQTDAKIIMDMMLAVETSVDNRAAWSFLART